MKWYIFTVPPNDAHKRVDALCKMMFIRTPFNAIMKWIRKGLIQINNHKTSADYRLHAHDTISVAQAIAYRLSPALLSKQNSHEYDAHAKEHDANAPKKLFSEDMLYTHGVVSENSLLFLNEDILAYNKAAQELLFGKNSITHTLQKYYTMHTNTLAFKPAPCHRLDTGTSGIVICALRIEAARIIAKFHNYIHKIYIALLTAPAHAQLLTHTLYRNKKSKVTIACPSEPSAQNTHALRALASNQYKMLGTASLWLHSIGAVDIRPRTSENAAIKKLFPTIIVLGGHGGKTHQIRAQCAAHNTPLWGDVKYPSYTTNNTEHYPPHSTYYLHASTILCDALPSQQQILPPGIIAPIPEPWYTLVQSKDHFLLRRAENLLDRARGAWEKERPTDRNTDITAWYSSVLGGVIG